ncbi:MAG: DMT superfamily drug/metabolite permease [Parcubacteria group bacterium Gr01-1014_107]|nr:MAG: DMT superfamily drug/metabolite permease [Parcubacteria group bacterium Gr01-1014_107]
MRQIYLGSGAVALAAILWSIDGLLRRALFSLPPSVVVFWEHAFGFLILLPFIIFFTFAVLALVAAYFVSFPDLKVNLETDAGTLAAALLAIGAAVSWGISTALSKYALKNVSSFHATAARFGLTIFFAFLVTLFLGKGIEITEVSAVQWKYIAAITFSTGLVALFIYYFGLKRILASRSTIIELIWPVSAIFIGYFFLGESLSITQWLGSIALVAIILFIIKNPRLKRG